MNQDAQIFNDNQECLNDQYLAAKLPEIPTEADSHNTNTTAACQADIPAGAAGGATTANGEDKKDANKKESLNWANSRFTMSTYQLYETKTVRSHRLLCIKSYL